MKLSAIFALPAALLVSSVALADVPPTCDQFNSNADCAQADVGKACPGGGTCTEISCEASAGGANKVLKCVSCDLVEIADPDKVCEPGPSSFGKTCGDGGTCTKLPSWCSSSGYVVCAKEGQGAGGSGQGGSGSGGSGQAGSGDAGAGGSGTAGSGDAGSGTAGSGTAGSGTAGSGTAGSGTAGTSDSGAASGDSDDSGCSVSGAGRHSALAGLMLALGAAALLFERRRR